VELNSASAPGASALRETPALEEVGGCCLPRRLGTRDDTAETANNVARKPKQILGWKREKKKRRKCSSFGKEKNWML
jgi:hypothetical protein